MWMILATKTDDGKQCGFRVDDIRHIEEIPESGTTRVHLKSRLAFEVYEPFSDIIGQINYRASQDRQ